MLHYVYIHTRLDTEEVFYVGIGTKSEDDLKRNVFSRANSKVGRSKEWFEITISFDYDLGEDEAKNLVKQGWSKRSARQHKKTVKSGFDCALWCKWFFKEKNIPLPQIHIHSKNPEGKEKLINLFK